MADFARISADLATGPLGEEESMAVKSERSKDLERRLEDWKNGLPGPLNLESSSLSENELITRQKVVLKIRQLSPKTREHRVCFADTA